MVALHELTSSPSRDVDKLLELLATVRDGEAARRGEVQTYDGNKEEGWYLSAGGYWVGVIAPMQCGFGEWCDGKLLHVVTERLDEEEAAFRMNLSRAGSGDRKWRVRIKLGRGEPWAEGCDYHPGVAALIAYLRAWGVVA